MRNSQSSQVAVQSSSEFKPAELHCQNDFALVLLGFHELVCLLGLGQGVHFVNDRLEAAVGKLGQRKGGEVFNKLRLLGFGPCPHSAADYGQALADNLQYEGVSGCFTEMTIGRRGVRLHGKEVWRSGKKY